jgi:hypothetical protein
MDIWLPTKRCGKLPCSCILPVWRMLMIANATITSDIAELSGIIPQPTRSSGILDGHPDVEVHSWVWKAENGKRLDIPEMKWMLRQRLNRASQ